MAVTPIDLKWLHQNYILDACSLIALESSGLIEIILEPVPAEIQVPELVIRGEALRVYNGPLDDPKSGSRNIELDDYLASGILHSIKPETEEEQNLFIYLASKEGGKLGDGEAMCAALAIKLNAGIITDDKKAINLIKRNYPSTQIITTAELLWYWASVANPTNIEISEALTRIQKYGVYLPAKSHPLSGWWQQYVPY